MDEGIDFRHTLIGDGDDRAQILRLVADLGLSERCRWLGTLPHETVLQHYREADLFVLGCEIADNGDRDGIPNVLMESMAMGVPVVATTASAILSWWKTVSPDCWPHPGHRALWPAPC
jgi:glycosyltransferase involved in cell wall biosynthesis